MFGFELFWPRTLVTAPGLWAYALAIVGMAAVMAVLVLIAPAKEDRRPIPVPFAMLGACVLLAGATAPYLLRQALTIVPFMNGVVETKQREFFVTGGDRERSGESVIRLTPVGYNAGRDVSLVVQDDVMKPMAARARAFRLGEVEERDCLVLTTEIGLWGIERIYSGAVMTRPVGELFISERC
ncbi:MAG: hypothetical protein AAF687_13265 [Pseudomonadota bacterium]